MVDLAKTAEGGLASEGVQFDAPVLTQTTSANTRVGDDAKDSQLGRTPSGHTIVGHDHDHDHDMEKGGVAGVPGSGTGEGLDESGILTGFKLYACFLAFMLSVFMFALDQSIVATAIPIIVSDFNAFAQVSWIITGYFLTQCGLVLLVGQLLTIVKTKWVLLAALFLFELGSLICGVSKSMDVLIFGRAIQGVGASGMFSSIMMAITVITRVEQRAAFMASFGFVFVISSVAGPLLGGVFTESVTWRWCFYINLPIGGLAAVAVVFLFPARDPAKSETTANKTTIQKLLYLDWIGSALILCIITCLLLALTDGGNKYAWSNWRIILEFVLGGVLIIVFALWQLRMDTRALVPKKIFLNRNEVAACCAIFMFMLGMLGGTYQVPLYYQAVRNQSPTESGISILPFMISCCVGIFISGGATTATGRYWPWTLAGPPFAAAGFGLLSTIDAHTSSQKLIGFQILAGFGIGLAFQCVILAPQAEFHDRPHLMPQAVGVVTFFQLTGGAIGVGIVNTVQSIYLNKELRARAPDVDFTLVRESVTAIWTSVPDDKRGPVIDAYVTAITKSFLPIYIAIAIAFVSCLFLRNHNMKEKGGAGAMAA